MTEEQNKILRELCAVYAGCNVILTQIDYLQNSVVKLREQVGVAIKNFEEAAKAPEPSVN